MNTTDRPTIPVPAASLSDAALLADYRARRAADVDFRLGEVLGSIGCPSLGASFLKQAANSYQTAVRAAVRRGR
jgi:hypothetical protein